MSTTQVYTEVLAEDVAEAVDAVPDVEAEPKDEPTEAERIASGSDMGQRPRVRNGRLEVSVEAFV